MKWFLITKRGALRALEQAVAIKCLDQAELWPVWNDLKAGYSDVLLPTGAKLFRDADGNMGVFGYAYDGSDVEQYLQYQIKES